MDAQGRIRKSNADVDALIKLFQNVKKHAEPVEIELAHGDEESSYPIFSRPNDFEDCKNACCRHGFAAPASDDIRPFEVLLEASAISGVEVKTLTVARSLEDGAWALPIHLIMMKDDLATHSRNVVRQTEQLDLALWVESARPDIQSGEYNTAVENSIVRFVKVLAEAPKLKSLALQLALDQYNSDLPDRNQTSPAILLNAKSAETSSLPAALLEQTSPHLETLAISFADLDVQKLLAFVKRQPKLRELNLDDVNLLENGMTKVELEQIVDEVCAAVPGSCSFSYYHIGGRLVMN